MSMSIRERDYNDSTNSAADRKNESHMGLSSEQAKALLEKYGPNSLASERKAKPLKIFMGQFRDIMVMILIIASAASFFIGEYTDAVTIIIIVVINAILGFVQEYRTEKTLLALKSMSAPMAKVFRDGRLTVIPGAELVPGDVISLESGDKAPADSAVISAKGLTADEMIDLFLENGVGTREGFEKAVKSSLVYDMDYRFLKELQAQETEGFENGRKYALEGYLYPDTYDFYTDASEIDAVSKLLETFNRRFEEAYYERCEELGMSVDEIVNLASIVQMETKYESEYETVSSLYHNRLNAPASFPRLQCDSTYLYIYPERRAELTLDEMKSSDNPYSTYSHDGLPPSAICSPSLNAIISALYPSSVDEKGVKHTYYYMVARPNGYHYFSQTEAGHLSNIERARGEAE